MFRDNRRFIAENATRDDYLGLDLSLNSSDQIWKRAIDIMRGRIEGRYLEPMETLIQADANKNGFAAMALCCLLIETLLQFREGFPQTPQRQNRRCYTEFLQTQLGHIFSYEMANRFYHDIRCGILHSAQTKNESCLTFGTNYVARIQGNNIMMVDVQGMYYEMREYFEKYCIELMISTKMTLRRNFIIKMDDIANKLEGIEALDNLWFAICANENNLVYRPNRRPFTFRVVLDGTALRMYNNITISRDEITSALYYWPNKKAIQMLDNGDLIYPILLLCEDIVDDIIRRHTA